MADTPQNLPDMEVVDNSSLVGTELTATSKSFSPGLPTGTGLGKYKLLERVRTYHNAIAYKARDGMLDRLVVIKQMAPDLIDNPVACGNFKREAQFLARVSFDTRFVVNIHELIEDEIGLFIVEEFVDAQWLESLIFKRRISAREAPRILRTAAQGLQLLHRHSIVHRDIHPGNILVASGGVAKIANLASSAHESDTTRPPVVTPKYAAPELLLEQKYDDRVDVYGLGMTLLEVCVGRRALNKYFADIVSDEGSAIGKWIDWQCDLDKPAPSARLLNPTVPAFLSGVIDRMTAKRLEERFTSIEEVIETLNTSAGAPSAASRRPFVGTSDQNLTSFTRKSLPSTKQATARGFTPPGSSWQPGPSTTQRGPSSTSAQTARPAAVAPSPATEHPRAAASAAPSYQSGTHAKSRHRNRGGTTVTPRPQVRIETLPQAPESTESFKRKYPRIIRGVLAASLLIGLVSYSGYWVWQDYLVGGWKNPAQIIYNLGEQAYRMGRFEEAELRFTELCRMELYQPNERGLQKLASGWNDLINAHNAITKGQYNSAEQLMADAKVKGIPAYQISEVQAQLLNRKEAEELVKQGMEALAHENFSQAERAFSEYERKAIAGGEDPNRLKESLDIAKRDYRYHKSINEARKALSKENFQAALDACKQAESIQLTSETRDLRKQITDARNRDEWVQMGNEAMTNKDYESAVSAYEQANSLFPAADVEVKLRTARARVFLDEGKRLISEGDLLAGEDKLKSAIYNAEIDEAKSKLERMAPAFEAARLVKQGDQAMNLKNPKEAERLYRAALPQLPNSARKSVMQKIDEAIRAAAIERGDLAFYRGELDNALDEYNQARKIRPGDDIDEKITRVKSQIP